ncbi:replication factor C large subunit [Thermogladius sp. 4427co]|uniref:replication factor C large subunit n=1 Tax=Thermogladius sp. 4427co TaxID=3450718 RepID=UPI003F7902EA
MSEYLPWIIKYRPKNLNEYVNQEKAKKAFIEWYEEWKAGKADKKAVLLHGPAGTGKSSFVQAFASTYNLELYEMNASDYRRKSDIERLVKIAASTGSLTGKGKLIFLDEVDGLNPKADAGGIEAIIELINISKHPIVMAANDAYNPNIKPLRDVSLLIPFERLKESDIVQVLSRICNQEKVKCDIEALKEIAKRSEGDLRSAINDLQAIAETYGRVTLELAKAVSTYRNREYAPFEVLGKLFNAQYIFQAREAINSANIDHDTLKVWINEHIPTYYENPEEIARAYDSLSRADVYFGRIIKSGSWDLLSYALELMGPGVAFARRSYSRKFRKFYYPEKFRLLSETKKSRELRDSIAEVLARRLLTSKATVKSDVIPFLKVIFTQNPKVAAGLARSYELTEDMVKFLAGSKANEVLGYLKKPSRAKKS